MDTAFTLKGQKRKEAFKFGIFFALLFTIASLLSACADSSSELSAGGSSAAAGTKAASAQRLCVAVTDYDGSAAPENLQAALNIRQLSGEADVNVKTYTADLNEAEGVPIPLYAEGEKEELQQQEAEVEASDYEEEPIPDELDDAEANGEDTEVDASAGEPDETDAEEAEAEECGEVCDHEHLEDVGEADLTLDMAELNAEDAAEADAEITLEAETEADAQEAEYLAALEAEAVPEEEADLQPSIVQSEAADSASDSEANNAEENESEAAAADSDFGVMQGQVYSSEAKLENGRLNLYFDIDSDLFPIEIRGLSISSDSGEGTSKYFSIRTVAESGSDSLAVSWQQKEGSKVNSEAAADRTEISARGETVKDSNTSGTDSSYSKYVYVRVKDVPSNPGSVSLSYTEDSGSAVKTVNIASWRSGLLTFGKILTNASKVTLKKIEVGTYVYNTARQLDLSSSDAYIEILSLSEFTNTSTSVTTYKIIVNNVPSKPSSANNQIDIYCCPTEEYPGPVPEYDSKWEYDASNKRLTFKLSIYKEVGKTYLFETSFRIFNRTNHPDITSDNLFNAANKTITFDYNSLVYTLHNYSIYVDGITKKPSFVRLYYTVANDSTLHVEKNYYSYGGNSLEFLVHAIDDVNVSKIIIDDKIYNKNLKYKVNPFVKTIFQIFKVGNLYSLKSSPYIMQLLGYNIQIQVSGN